MAESSDRTAPTLPSSRPEPSSSRSAEQVSFDDWARQSGPRLLRFAQVVTGRNDAADAVQDALVAVFARWRRLSRAGTPDGYARRVIVNRHISRWRRWGRREQLAEKVEPASDPADVAAAVSDAALARQVLAEPSRDSVPRSCCGSTTTWPTARSPTSWTAPTARPARTSAAR